MAEMGLRWWRREAAGKRMEIPMPKAQNSKNPATIITTSSVLASRPVKPIKSVPAPRSKDTAPPISKQDRVRAMLKTPAGVTIGALSKATGWQKHSVRGFLAGVVRKKLRLKLRSEKVDGNRVYRVDGTGNTVSKSARRRVA